MDREGDGDGDGDGDGMAVAMEGRRLWDFLVAKLLSRDDDDGDGDGDGCDVFDIVPKTWLAASVFDKIRR